MNIDTRPSTQTPRGTVYLVGDSTMAPNTGYGNALNAVRTVRDQIYPIRDAAGRRCRFGGFIHDITEERWRQAWELKLYSYINLTRAYLPSMEKRGKGVIANIIGMAGAAPRYEYICGSAANAALIAFTQGLGGGTVRQGVRVFGINPSPTRSDRMQGMLQQQATTKLGDASRWHELTLALPFGRLAEPDEIAKLTAFCASPLCGYLSGSVINVDGGQMFTTPSK